MLKVGTTGRVLGTSCPGASGELNVCAWFRAWCFIRLCFWSFSFSGGERELPVFQGCEGVARRSLSPALLVQPIRSPRCTD